MATITKAVSIIKDQFRGDNLKARCTRSSLTLGVGTFIERALRLTRYMILTRLLAPQDFGLMALVMAVSAAFLAFADIGIKQSVIQNRRGAELEYLNAAWWLQALRGFVLFAIGFFASPVVCRFYDKPELLPLLRISFLFLVFSGFISPRIHILQKEFQFVKSMLLIQGSGFLATIVTIVVAFYIRNIWALVIGLVSESMILCILSLVFCPLCPRFRIDWASLGELLKYARGMLGLSLLTIVSLQADVAVLGKIVSTQRLGMYSLALALAQQPTGLLFRIVGPVLLPAFAEKQDEKQALCQALLKIIRISLFVGAPVTALLAFFSETILSVIYGSQYAAVALPFAILCVAMLIRMHGSILALVYQAIGKPHLHRRYVSLLVLLIISLMYPGIVLFGLAGAAGVLLLSYTVAVCMQVVWMGDAIGLRFESYARCWLPVPSVKWLSLHNSYNKRQCS